MKARLPRLLCYPALLFIATVASWGQLIVPVSYTATPGGTGAFTYFDPNNTKLTDGRLGVDDWTADLGNGNAQEWLGWTNQTPSMTFTFTGTPTISTVSIGFNRGEGTGSIFLPTSVTINGTLFNLTGTELADNTRGFLSFSGPWIGNTVQIDLVARGAYTFVDEVLFSPVAVPEPATWALLALGSATIIGARRRSRLS